MESTNSQSSGVNGWMLMALGALAWAVSIGGHELLGHGGICFVDSACTWNYADAMYFDGNQAEGAWTNLQVAAGSVFNILLAFSAATWLRFRQPTDVAVYLFLWILLLVNLFQSGSYIAFGQFIDSGMDWARLSKVISPGGFGGLVVLAIGTALIITGAVLGFRLFPGPKNNTPLTLSGRLKILFLPYLGCSIVAIAASLLVPADDRFYMLMGGIGGSMSFLIWMPLMAFIPQARGRLSQLQEPLDFDLRIFAISILAALGFIFVLGPGIDFS
jgi:hypothetical protein